VIVISIQSDKQKHQVKKKKLAIANGEGEFD